MKINPNCQRRKCRPRLVSWKWCLKRQWGCRQQQFSMFSLAVSFETLQISPASWPRHWWRHRTGTDGTAVVVPLLKVARRGCHLPYHSRGTNRQCWHSLFLFFLHIVNAIRKDVKLETTISPKLRVWPPIEKFFCNLPLPLDIERPELSCFMVALPLDPTGGSAPEPRYGLPYHLQMRGTAYGHRDRESLVGFLLIPKHVTLSDLNGHFTLNSVFTPVRIASDTVTFEKNCVKTNPDRTIIYCRVV